MAARTPTMAKTACAPVSHEVESSGFCSVRSATFFIAGENAGDQDQERRPCGKGVVLLVGGDGEEEQGECGKEPEQPRGAHAELETRDVAGDIFADRVLEVEVHGLAGIAMEMLHPWRRVFHATTSSAGRNRLHGKSQTRCEQPIGDERQAIVVVRKALAEETQEVFVDEVESTRSRERCLVWVIADGVSLVGVRESGEDVPRRGDGEEEQDSRDGLQVAPAAPLSAQQQQGNGRGGEEDGSDESLGQVARASAAHMP